MNKKYSFRTDLACEALLRNEDCLETINEVYEKDKIKITKTIVCEKDVEILAKKSGTYYAIDLTQE